MHQQPRRLPINQKQNQFDGITDPEDIEDPDDASSSQLRPSPRFTTARTPKAQAPTQPQHYNLPSTVSESKPAKSSRFLDKIDPDLIAASSNSLKPAVKEKEKRNTPVTRSERLGSSSLVVGIRDLTSDNQPQFRKPPLFTSRLAEFESSSGTSTSRHADVVTPRPRPWKPPPASSARDRSARRSRFRDELDPDLLALVAASKRRTRVDLNVPPQPVPAVSEDGPDFPLVASGSRMPMQGTDIRVSGPIPDQEPEPSDLQRIASYLAATPRPQDILDLAALSSTNGKTVVSETPTFKPLQSSGEHHETAETPVKVAKAATTLDYISSDRTTEKLLRSLVRTPGGLQYDESRAMVIPSRSVSFNKRPRARSSSPPDFVPDTPRPKRQQQQDQRQVDIAAIVLGSFVDNAESGAITVAPQSEDEIEDPESPTELVHILKPPQKRQVLEIDSSPTALVKLRKRQKILTGGEDIIVDDPNSPPIPVRRHRISYSVVPKRIYDASSSGDEVAENINITDPKDKLKALAQTQLLAPSPTRGSQPGPPKPRPLMNLDAIRHRLNTKPAPTLRPTLKPGMINVLTHHKQLIIPREPTPPPPSPPRRGYVERGLAETAMWWKHDAKELTLRSVFADDKPKLAFCILVQELLRDGDMCVIRGLGENQSGREGRVKAIVTDGVASAVTRVGLTLFYEKPWFPVTLFGETKPYRILIGRWDVRDVGVKTKTEKREKTKEPKESKGKEKEKMGKAENTRNTMGAGKSRNTEKVRKAR